MRLKDPVADILRPAPPVILKPSYKHWSRKKILIKLQEINDLETSLVRKLEEVKEADPFWHFQPTHGILTPEGHTLLKEFLRPEDIPVVFQSQTDIFRSMAPIRLAGGGNQSGKTTTGTIETFIQLTGCIPKSLEGIFPEAKLPKRYPFFVRVVGEDYENGIVANLIPTYRYWAPKEYLIGGNWEKSFQSGTGVLTIVKDGRLRGTVEFMSNKQEVGSFQGPPRHKLVYDEEPREDIFQENLFRFTTSERLDILIAMTPTKGLTWVADQIADGGMLERETVSITANDIQCFEMATVINPKANLKVVRMILQHVLSYPEKQMRLLGKFISLAGRIYGGVYSRGIHVIPPFEFKREDMVVFRGVDPHLSKPSVAVFLGVDREDNAYVLTTLKKQCDTQVFKDELQALSSPYRLAWSVVDQSADSTAHAFSERNIYKELTTGKNPIRAVKKSFKYDGSIKAGIDSIMKALRNSSEVHNLKEVYAKKLKEGERPQEDPPTLEGMKLYIFDVPENRELMKSFMNLEREKRHDEDEKGKKDKIAEGKHDAHACLRYIFQHRISFIDNDHDVVPQYEPDVEGGSY